MNLTHPKTVASVASLYCEEFVRALGRLLAAQTDGETASANSSGDHFPSLHEWLRLLLAVHCSHNPVHNCPNEVSEWKLRHACVNNQQGEPSKAGHVHVGRQMTPLGLTLRSAVPQELQHESAQHRSTCPTQDLC